MPAATEEEAVRGGVRSAESVALALAGVFVPATSPFDPVTGDLDLVSLRANLRRVLSAPVQGLVIGGTTGEALLLTGEERRAALEAAAELLGDERLLIAGTGAESTRETVRLSVEAAAAGADAVLVQPPAYYRNAMSDRLLALHYRAVAEASPLPVILYQAPLTCSTLELSTPLVAGLSEHPGIIGIKDSRGKLPALGEHLGAVAEGFRVLVGNGAKLYAALEMGAAGGILGISNVVPAEAAEIYRCQSEGRPAEAGWIQERIAPLHNEIVGGLGVPGVKAALDLVGAAGGAPRPPLAPADARAVGKIRELLEDAGFLDTGMAPA